MDLSRDEVHEEGYHYKKGVSRSKRLHVDGFEESTPKRPKVCEDLRLRRIGELEEDIQDASDQISIKAK